MQLADLVSEFDLEALYVSPLIWDISFGEGSQERYLALAWLHCPSKATTFIRLILNHFAKTGPYLRPIAARSPLEDSDHPSVTTTFFVPR